jgi:hypothetical protein
VHASSSECLHNYIEIYIFNAFPCDPILFMVDINAMVALKDHVKCQRTLMYFCKLPISCYDIFRIMMLGRCDKKVLTL